MDSDEFYSKSYVERNHFDAVSVSPAEDESCLRIKYNNKYDYDRLCAYGDPNSRRSEGFTPNMFTWVKEFNIPSDFLGFVCLEDGTRVREAYDNYPADTKFAVFNKGGKLIKDYPAYRVDEYYRHKRFAGAAHVKHGKEFRGVSSYALRKYNYVTLQSTGYTSPAIVVDCDLKNSVEYYNMQVLARRVPQCSFYIENRETGHTQFFWLLRAISKSANDGRLAKLFERLWLTLTILLNGDIHFTGFRHQNPYFKAMPATSRHIVVPDAENGFRMWSLQGLVCDLHNAGSLIPESELTEKYGYTPWQSSKHSGGRFSKLDVFGRVGLNIVTPTANNAVKGCNSNDSDTISENESQDFTTKIDIVADKSKILANRGGINPQLFTPHTLYTGVRYSSLFSMLTWNVWHPLRYILLSTTSKDDILKLVEREAFQLRDTYCKQDEMLPDCEIRQMSKHVANYFIRKANKNALKANNNVNSSSFEAMVLAADLSKAASGESTNANNMVPLKPQVTPEQHDLLSKMGRNGGRAKTFAKTTSSAHNISGYNNERIIEGRQTSIKVFEVINSGRTVSEAARILKMPRTTVKSAFLRYYSNLINNVETIVEDFIIKMNLHHANDYRRVAHLRQIYAVASTFFMLADKSFNDYVKNMLEKIERRELKAANSGDSGIVANNKMVKIVGVSTSFSMTAIVNGWLNSRVAEQVHMVYRNLILFALAASARSWKVRWTRGCTKARKMFIWALKRYKFDGHEYEDYANTMFEDYMMKVFDIMTSDKQLGIMADKILDNAVYKKRMFNNMPVVKSLLDNRELMDSRTFEITA